MRIFVALLIVNFAQAQSAVAPSKQDEVDRIFAAFNTHTPGCAVGVAQNGAVVLRSGYGMADLERNVPITAGTVFESGSVAKQFTATALMLLAQQGKISLDDPMRKYLPELPDYGAPLTIRQVLSHTSGLREWRTVAMFAGREEGRFVLTNQDLLEMASWQRGLNFDSGSAYSYTNTGFNISAILIERVSGKTFQQFTHDEIFEPLKMVHTRWRDDFRAVVPGRALAYGRQDEGWVQQTPIENIIGAGGMLSTVGDWLLWNENFTHARIGGADFVKLQQTPAVLKSGKTIAYAAGLTVGAVDGLREVSHGGATGGYRTWLARYPEPKVSVAVMCNSAQANPSKLGRETARLWTGVKAHEKPEKLSPDPASLTALEGMYRKVRDNSVIHLTMADGKLMFEKIELTPVRPGKFLLNDEEIEIGSGLVRVPSPNGDTVYERVEPTHPSATELAAFAGEYASKEAMSTVKVAVKDGGLTITIGTREPSELKPTFRDAFAMRSGASIRFIRDGSGKVMEMSAGDDRVWDLRFGRVR